VRNIAAVDDVSSGKDEQAVGYGLVLSNPLFGKGGSERTRYRELLGSKFEGKLVKEVLESNLNMTVDSLSRKTASKSALIEMLRAHQRAIVHLSSHGDVIGGVPCLILKGANDGEDAILKPGEIPDAALKHASLVVFALCHAGKMDTTAGDGLGGFVKSALLSGALSAVMPICEVADAESIVFFELFYKEYVEQPNQAVEATLRRTIERIRRMTPDDLTRLSKDLARRLSLSARETERLASLLEGSKLDDSHDRVDIWGPWVCYSNRKLESKSSEEQSSAIGSYDQSVGIDKAHQDEGADTHNGRVVNICDDKRLSKKNTRKQQEAFELFGAGKTRAALKVLLDLEEAGCLTDRGAAVVAAVYSHDPETEDETSKSFTYALASAKTGCNFGMQILGECLYCGRGCARDAEKALIWFERAAGGGNNIAAAFLSEMHYYGIGASRSCEKAIKWAKKAVRTNQSGLIDIAQLYLAGASLALGWKDERVIQRVTGAYKELADKRFLAASAYNDATESNDKKSGRFIALLHALGPKDSSNAIQTLLERNQLSRYCYARKHGLIHEGISHAFFASHLMLELIDEIQKQQSQKKSTTSKGLLILLNNSTEEYRCYVLNAIDLCIEHDSEFAQLIHPRVRRMTENWSNNRQKRDRFPRLIIDSHLFGPRS